ncbi:MAG TPA: hypothetical protein VFP65_00290 [Anaeromyxobacteraceae bacterium]|nr:hypothetical protein [Anaeromyxobacteraceae bacterium]
MKTRRHAAPTPASKTTFTTVGDLVAAACDLTPGSGTERAERVARLLADAALARRCSRPLRFVR